MLVLSRTEGEEIHLTLEDGRKIVIRYVGHKSGKARIGIDAPRTINVVRSEIDNGKARTNESDT